MSDAIARASKPVPPLAGVFVITVSLALSVPMLLAYNIPPSSTFLNQAAALIGWGSCLTWLATRLSGRIEGIGAGVAPLHSALALLALAALASPLWAHLPWSLSLSGAGMIAAAMLTVQVGAAAQREGLAVPAFRAFCIGLVIAGVASAVVGIVQVFAPGWPDGDWIARSYVPGRAVGNMRQPNHLSSLLLWSVVAAVWLGEAGVLRRVATRALVWLFIFVVVLSASRTGTLSVGLLALWGLLDKRLSRSTRWLLGTAPLAYAVFWLGASAWADYGHHVFGGETRFSTKGDISSSRWGIWSNTLALIQAHPWWGVGWGEFNFAWTLTPFPGRPVAFFDHTHNLALQFAVELGLPLASVVLALLGWALVRAARAAALAPPGAASGPDGVRPAAFAMVFLILVHSLLEYPLWYAYYLLPAAFAFGLCLARGGTAPARPAAPAVARARPLLLATMVLMIGGLGAVWDYARVAVIFAPPAGAAPLAQRIDEGRRSLLFAHQADYAAATTVERPGDVMAAFRRAPHFLLDARLMQVWATALDQAGRTEQARYVAERLREFRNEQSEPFFAVCQEAPGGDAPGPFQCTPPSQDFSYEDFR